METFCRVLVESSLRATIMASGVSVVLWIVRIQAPAIRHRAWTGVLAAMLFLPVLSAWDLKVAVPLLPPVSRGVPQKSVDSAPDWKSASRSAEIASLPPTVAAGVRNPAANESRPARLTWFYKAAAALYTAGLFICLSRLLAGTLLSYRLLLSAKNGCGFLRNARCTAPVTVGLLRARILLPDGAEQWDPDTLGAVLAHEREHVHRRDPLIRWLALLNRSVYWFHPLAWWLSGRLASLAEQACDEAVLARGHDSARYAELLLELARSVKRGGGLVTAWGSALSGSRLAARIRRIASYGPIPSISRRRLLLLAALCAFAILAPATAELVRVGAAMPELQALQSVGVQPLAPARKSLPGRSLPDRKVGGDSAGEPSPTIAINKVGARDGTGNQSQEADLGDNYRKWLNEEVFYIITAEEKAVFLALKSAEERDRFIAQFWARREPAPGAGTGKFKNEHYRRLAYANKWFAARDVPGWKTDRGRIYILYGEPDGKEAHPQREFWQAGGSVPVYPFEIWRYRRIPAIGDDVEFRFVDRALDGKYALETNPVRDRALQDLQLQGRFVAIPYQSAKAADAQMKIISILMRQMGKPDPGQYEKRALAEINRLMQLYPTSEYVPIARQYRDEVLLKLREMPTPVRGQVVNSAGNPISGVTVSVVDPKTKAILFTAASDKEGNFELKPGRSEGPFEILFEKQGYRSYTFAEDDPYSSPLKIVLVSAAELNCQVADFYRSRGNYVAAIARYLEALRLQPDLPAASVGLGRSYLETGEYKKALAIYRDFTRKFPDSPHVRLFQAWIAEAEKAAKK